MSIFLKQRIEQFAPRTPAQYENALKQIIQELTLLGLERGKFFEKAAFYGGTALRILYGLPRFSEDLDFTLLKDDAAFSLTHYFQSIERELAAYGFKVDIKSVKKTQQTEVESAFVKAETKIHLLKVEAPSAISQTFQNNQTVQIKFEVDTQPALHFETENKLLLNPTTFQIISLKIPDLFAGKMHAVLFRAWKNRVKGRDFFDLTWYLKLGQPLRSSYLKAKMIQGEKWGPTQELTQEKLVQIFKERIKNIDFEAAKKDILPFLTQTDDIESLHFWSHDFFSQIIEQIKII